MANRQGPDRESIGELSAMKGEPDWLLSIRLEALNHYGRLSVSNRHRSLLQVEADGLFPRPVSPQPAPGSRRGPAGPAAEDDGEAALRRNLEDLRRRGVICCDLQTAVREHPALVKPYLATVVPPGENKFSALNTSVWSGGWFVYVPPGVEVGQPIQVNTRSSARPRDRFDRTLIVADEGAVIHYIEGCSAPVYSPDPLHSAVAEVVVKPGARVTHTAIQNWSSNVSNLVTRGAVVQAEGHVEWIDGNIGSRLTVTRPTIHLAGPKATATMVSVDYAGGGQYQDTAAAVIHDAPETGSTIVARAVVKDGGRTNHRSVVRVAEHIDGCSSRIRRDALIVDGRSVAGAHFETDVDGVRASGFALDRADTVSRVAAEQVFYLMSRGLSEGQSRAMVVNGFVEPVTGTLPVEYAVEWSRLIELQMEDSVG